MIADERGSIVAVTNGAGAASFINAYDEYGQPGPSNIGRFGFTGQAWLPEAQLYHYKARAYAPALGRFLQTDPVGFGGGMNLYAYVGNDPVNWTDPWGLAPELQHNPNVVCIDNCGGGDPPYDEIIILVGMSSADRMMWEEYLQHYASTHSYLYFYDETHEAEERSREAEEDEIVVTAQRCDAACQLARDFQSGGLWIQIQDFGSGPTSNACLAQYTTCQGSIYLFPPGQQQQQAQACQFVYRTCTGISTTVQTANDRRVTGIYSPNVNGVSVGIVRFRHGLPDIYYPPGTYQRGD